MVRDIDKELGLDEVLGMEASSLVVRLDTRRYGKNMTIIEGFDTSVDVASIAKDLKEHLGTGGTVKEGHIELQGDHRKAARARLELKGYVIQT
jgi:translation initiation factor 1